jgi:glucose/arabinose dehydrogenase
MKAEFKSTIRVACHSFGGAILLIASSAQAQNLFVSSPSTGSIIEITPSGTQSTFASGLGDPGGLAFNSAGDLFVGDYRSNNITEITPSGVQSTFASGLEGPEGLAFNSAGNLFVALNSGPPPTTSATSLKSRWAERQAPLAPSWLVFQLE